MLAELKQQVEELAADVGQLGEQLQSVKRLRWPLMAAAGTELEAVRKKIVRLRAALAKSSNSRAES